jgi:two-component system chemotaxis sensor kinase CheA
MGNENKIEMDPEILREFLTESVASLDIAANSLVILEKDPENEDHVNSAFRVFHSIKGACSFFDLSSVRTISHKIETLLSEVKSKVRRPDMTIISVLLEGVDILKSMLDHIGVTSINSPLTDKEVVFLAQLDKLLNEKEPPIYQTASELLNAFQLKQSSFENADKELSNKIQTFFKNIISKNPSHKNSLQMNVQTMLDTQAQRTQPQVNATSEGSSQPKSEVSGQSTINVQQNIKKTMRVEEETIDTFLSYTGELISSSETFGYLQGKLAHSELDSQVKSEFKSAVLTFQTLSQDLQKSIMDIRKLPLSSIFSKYPRMIRDLTVALNKKVNLQTKGDELRVDKSIIELLDDPMVHILRNSLDHGLEGSEERIKNGKQEIGNLTLTVVTDESVLILKVKDDGRGIVPEKIKNSAIGKGLITKEQASQMSSSELIQLIFKPGFSTAEKTTDVSGRGVGMDVVLTNIKKANGTIDISSVPGAGTEITIKIPLAVTTLITKGLILTAGDELLIIPVEQVRSMEEAPISSIFRTKQQQEAINLKNRILPICRLTQTLGWKQRETSNFNSENVLIAVVEIDQVQLALVIDGLLGIQQVALKETGKFFSKNPFLRGGAVLRDGRVGLFLNLKALISGKNSEIIKLNSNPEI